MVFGATTCGLMPHEDAWIQGDKWADRDHMDKVDCEACLKEYTNAEGRQKRRLPYGGETYNNYEYLTAWGDIVTPLLSIFEGYSYSSFDPDIVLVKYTTTVLGQRIVADRVVLSVFAAKMLIDKMKK